MVSDEFINANETDTDEEYKETNLVTRLKIKTIYEHLNLYSKEQVDAVLEVLSEKDRNIIRARYGNDLNNPVAQKMTGEDSVRFYSFLLPKMKRLLSNFNVEEKTKKIKTIYELLESYSKEQINTMLGNLSEEEKALIVARYGNDLDNPVFGMMTTEDRRRFYYYLVPRMKKLLTDCNRKSKLKTIYELLDSYSREQVDTMLENLSEKDKALIVARYGDDLNNPISGKMVTEDRHRFYAYLVPKMKKMLADPSSDRKPKLKTIYELLDSYSKEQVDAMLENLPEEDKVLIVARYGNDLDDPVFQEMTTEDSKKFYNCLLPKMRRLLYNPTGVKKTKRVKTIYELLDSYSKEQVDAVLENLSEKDKALIVARYGDDLNNPISGKMVTKDRHRFYAYLVPKMKKMLTDPSSDRKPKLKTIYELLDSYSREQVDTMLENLPEEDKVLIVARYGNDLDDPIFQEMTMEDSKKFYNCLLPKMRRLLYNPTGVKKTKRVKTIYELLDSYSKEQVDAVLENLSEKDKALIVARYGNDLDNPLSTKLTKEESIEFYNVLVPRMRKLLAKSNRKIESKTMSSEEVEILSNNQEFNIPVLTEEIPEDDLSSVNTKIMTRDDCIKTLQLIPGILKTMDICSSREIGLVSLVMSLKLGCIERKCFSNSDISEILGIESQEVIDITKRALLACKREISQFVDSTIEVLDEESDKKDNKVFYKVLPDNKNPKA